MFSFNSALKLLLGLALFINAPISASYASYEFDGQAGSGDYIAITDDALLSFPNDEWAIILWVKRSALSADTSTWSSEYLLSNGAFSGANTVHFYISHSNNSLNFKLTGASGEEYHTNSNADALDTTDWSCVVVQRESDTNVRIYVNAVEVGDEPKSQGTTSAIDLASGYIIGGRGDLDSNRYFDGLVEDLGFRSGSSFSGAEQTDLCGTPKRLSAYTTDVTWYHDLDEDLNADIGTLTFTDNGATQNASSPAFGSAPSSSPVVLPFGLGGFNGIN
jgi:hypothetical protein